MIKQLFLLSSTGSVGVLALFYAGVLEKCELSDILLVLASKGVFKPSLTFLGHVNDLEDEK